MLFCFNFHSIFCFNFRSPFIVLISFLLNIGKEMSIPWFRTLSVVGKVHSSKKNELHWECASFDADRKAYKEKLTVSQLLSAEHILNL